MLFGERIRVQIFLTISAALMALSLLTSCNIFGSKDSDLTNDLAAQPTLVEASIDGNKSEGFFSSSAATGQKILGTGSVSGSSLLIPAGALASDTSVLITDRSDISAAASFAEVGVPASFWSSSTRSDSPSIAWSVDLFNGYLNNFSKTNDKSVLCVSP